MISKSYIVENDNNFFSDISSALFYGENLGLKKDFKEKIKILNPNTKFISLFQDSILKKPTTLETEIQNDSLFDDKKIIFIEQANDKILTVLEENFKYIKKNKIIIFSDILEKKSKLRNFYEKSTNFSIIACYPDDSLSIKKIIQKRLKKFKELTSYNINLILESSNLDRIKLNNEIDKIISYFQDKSLESSKLEVLLDIKINENFNSLRNEALNGNKTKTNKLLSDTIIDSEKNIYYLALINQRLNVLSEILSNTQKDNVENIINRIKPPVFWKDKPNLIFQTKIWNQKKIKIILEKTYKTEIQIKSNSTIDKNLLIKKLVLDMCEIANSQ